MKMTRFARELRAHARAEMAAFKLLGRCPECLLLLTDATVRGRYARGLCSACGGDWRISEALAALQWSREA